MKLPPLHALLAAAIFFQVSSVAASPVAYHIDFGPGTASTTTGSFVYDSTLAANQQFSSFFVIDRGFVFDFTAAANRFSFISGVGSFYDSCNTPMVNDAFELLTNAACVATAPGAQNRYWDANIDFFFSEDSGTGSNRASVFLSSPNQNPADPPPEFGSFYLATAVTLPSPGAVPEPETLFLLALGALAGVLGLRRKGLPL